MKKTLFNYGRLFWVISLILSCLVFTTKSYSEEANLKINILNLDKPGVLYLSICKDAAGFEETVENESEEASCITSSGEIELQNFEINSMIPHGEYAISLFVDSNGNKKIDKNFLGIPKEQYGFSNNAMGRMSAPTFDQAKFLVAGPTTQNIKLRIGIPKQD
ncbi:DUF2141 domain-containing protein [Gammaproteobacteria bacterium]|nr:DUF2141 domain-containing protein [Gammaproteobacteria bacterium]